MNVEDDDDESSVEIVAVVVVEGLNEDHEFGPHTFIDHLNECTCTYLFIRSCMSVYLLVCLYIFLLPFCLPVACISVCLSDCFEYSASLCDVFPPLLLSLLFIAFLFSSFL